MARDLRSYIEDLQSHLAKLHTLTLGKTIQDLEEDFELRWAIERGFEIVGEILRRVEKIEPQTADRIDAIGKIIGFRNVLAHEYDNVEAERVWSITQANLPRLTEQIDAWAAELGMEAPPEPAS